MAKNCSRCGKQLSFRNSFVWEKRPVCRVCLKGLSQGQKWEEIPEPIKETKQDLPKRDLKIAIPILLDNWQPLYLVGICCILFPVWTISLHNLTPAANFMIGLWILLGVGLLFRVKLALLIALLGLPFGYCYDFVIYLLDVKSPFGHMAFYFVPPSSLFLSVITNLFANELHVSQFSEKTFLWLIYYYVHLLILIPPYGGHIISKGTYLFLLIAVTPLCGIYEMIFSYYGPFRERNMNLIHGMLIGTYIWVVIMFLKKFELNFSLRLGNTGNAFSYNKADKLSIKGNSPELFQVVKKGNLDRVKFLLENGTNANEKFKDGLTALIVAAKAGNLEILRALLKSGADVNGKTDAGLTALRVSTEKGHIDIVRELLDAGADMDIRGDDQYNALLLSMELKHHKIAGLLIERGANLKITDREGYTPLIWSIGHNNMELASLIIEKGANVNEQTKGPESTITPLFFAVALEREDMVRLLLDHDADVNVRIDYGETPLMFAAESGFSNIARMLIDRGADVNARKHNGISTLQIAEEAGHDNIVRLLKKTGAKSSF